MRTSLARNPLTNAAAAVGGGRGDLAIKRRLDIHDALMRPLARHTSQRRVLDWASRVACNRRGEAHSGNLAVIGPRRSGKSRLADILAALLVALDGFVLRIMANTLNGPTATFLETAKDGGLVGRLFALGLERHMDIDRAAGSIIAIKFRWGSELHVHDVGNERAIKKHHGITADLYWFDEAQHIDLLHKALANLVAPTLSDSRGAILLSGTPGEQIGSLFHRITSGRDTAYSVVRVATWHNPLFGASPLERWHHILNTSLAAARAQYSVTDEQFLRMWSLSEVELDAIATGNETGELAEFVKTLDSELLRQLLGRWVTNAAMHVFAWHRVAAETLYYCRSWDSDEGISTLPMVAAAIPDGKTPSPDIWPAREPDMGACVQQLPSTDWDGDRILWQAAISLDIGYSTDPCSIVVLAWSLQHPVTYEVYSNKWRYLADSAMLAKLDTAITTARDCGLRVGTVIADANGMRTGTRVEWDNILSQRYADLGVGVRGPYKPAGYKEKRIHAVNLDIEQGRFRCVAGSPLDLEGRNLRFLHADPALGPSKVDKHRVVHNADGTTTMPGNDCLDNLLYAAEDAGHLLCSLSQPPTTTPSTPVASRRASFLERQDL